MGFFSKLVMVGAVAYSLTVIWSLYYLSVAVPCAGNMPCAHPAFNEHQKVDVYVYTSPRASRIRSARQANLLWSVKGINMSTEIVQNVTVPLKGTRVRRNGTLHAHVLVTRAGVNPDLLSSDSAYTDVVYATGPLVHHMVPIHRGRTNLINKLTSRHEQDRDQPLQLVLAVIGTALILGCSYFLHHPRLGGISYALLCVTTIAIFSWTIVYRTQRHLFNPLQDIATTTQRRANAAPIAHWIPVLKIHLLSDFSTHRWDMNSPTPVMHMLSRLSRVWQVPGQRTHLQYAPVVYVDLFSHVHKHFLPLSQNQSRPDPKLIIHFQPVSLFRAQLLQQMALSVDKMKQIGLSDHDLDDVKDLFSSQRLYILMLTYVISVLHLVFDFLAFKNDIGFFKGRERFVGLSSRTITANFICSLVIYLYLVDNELTSTLVLGSVGVSTLIELWKVKRVLRVHLQWHGNVPWVVSTASDVSQQSSIEKETEKLDTKAMSYLSWALYPIIGGLSVYSLIYHPQKSWWSWAIGSLAYGVYAFGFIMMTPQLFINYQLKSVAHLPWRVFMYKAFNTFIDDVFSFIVNMPTAHRVACLRDDVVFFVYLYQRWLYPVDKTRANEYGIAYEESEDGKAGKGKPAAVEAGGKNADDTTTNGSTSNETTAGGSSGRDKTASAYPDTGSVASFSTADTSQSTLRQRRTKASAKGSASSASSSTAYRELR